MGLEMLTPEHSAALAGVTEGGAPTVTPCAGKPWGDWLFIVDSIDPAIGREQVYVLTHKQSEQLHKEEIIYTALINALQTATSQGDEAAITAAKEKLAEQLTTESLIKPAESKGSSLLTEVRRLAGYKTTYVPSKKLKSHWRKYKLDADDRGRSMRTTRGQLDRKKLMDQFTALAVKIKVDLGSTEAQMRTGIAGFDDYIAAVNRSLGWSLQKGVPPEHVQFDVSSAAQLMRFYAGASFNAEWDPRSGKFGLQAQASAKAALAEAQLEASGYFPNARGQVLRLTQRKPDGSSVTVDFGYVRGRLRLEARAFVGASIQGCIGIHAELGKGICGGDKPIKLGDKDAPRASVSGKAFAGAEASGTLAGAIEWDNPEHRKPDGSPDWRAFIEISVGASVAIGIGGELDFQISLEGGRFRYRGRLGLVCGWGFSGECAGEIDANLIWEFVQFVYHKLKDSNFSILSFITEEAFHALTMLEVWAIEQTKKIGDYLGARLDEVQRWWDDRKATSEAARRLADTIIANPQHPRYLTPEGKGAILYTLTETFHLEFEERQEQAALIVLSWIHTRHEFANVCRHITPNGTKCSFTDGCDRLEHLFDGFEQSLFDAYWRSLVQSYRVDPLIDTAAVQSFSPDSRA